MPSSPKIRARTCGKPGMTRIQSSCPAVSGGSGSRWCGSPTLWLRWHGSTAAPSNRFDRARLPGRCGTPGAYPSNPRFLKVVRLPSIGELGESSIPTGEALPRDRDRTRGTEMGDCTRLQNQQDAAIDRYRKQRASDVQCEPCEPCEPCVSCEPRVSYDPLDPCSKISLSGSSTSSGSSSSFLIRLRPSANRPKM